MDLAYELHDLVRTLDREADQMLRAESLSYNRYLALVILSEHPGMTSRQLAGAVGISEPSMSALVRQLQSAGLIDDARTPGSGNVRRLHTTRRGEDKIRTAGALLGGTLDDTARRLGIDPTELADTIHRLHSAVRGEAPIGDAASEGTNPTDSETPK